MCLHSLLFRSPQGTWERWLSLNGVVLGVPSEPCLRGLPSALVEVSMLWKWKASCWSPRFPCCFPTELLFDVNRAPGQTPHSAPFIVPKHFQHCLCLQIWIEITPKSRGPDFWEA